MPPLSIRPFSTRTITGGLFIVPTIYVPYQKVEIQITNADGTNSTITLSRGTTEQYLIQWEVTGRVNAIKQANVTLDNNDGFWANKFVGGETLTIYADYTNTLGNSERIFVGKIDEYRHSLSMDSGFQIEIVARQTPELEDRTLNKIFENVDAGTAVSTIVSENFSGIITTTDVGVIGSTVTIELTNETGVNAINRILGAVGYQWHIREDASLQVFKEGTRNNDAERAGVGVNIASASSVGRDFKDVKNRVFVYGSTVEDATNIFHLQTREDTDSQNRLWTKDLIVNDGNVDSTAHASTLAATSIITNPDRRGIVQCAGGLLTLQPGQSINVELPYMELQGKIIIGEYRHTFDTSGLNTFISISLAQENLARIFQERIAAEKGLRQVQNANGMKNANIFSFDGLTDTESQTNTTIAGNALLLNNASTGRWIGRASTLNASSTQAELRVDGEDLGACTYEVSLDGGVTFTSIVPDVLTTISPGGKSLKVRVTLQTDGNNAVPRLDTLAVFTK